MPYFYREPLNRTFVTGDPDQRSSFYALLILSVHLRYSTAFRGRTVRKLMGAGECKKKKNEKKFVKGEMRRKKFKRLENFPPPPRTIAFPVRMR